jgi:DNA-binding transcriptional regulator YiaG
MTSNHLFSLIKKMWVNMTSDKFVSFRKKLKKTQKQMAQLLGISIKAVRSYEQGWRTVPSHVERQLLFLITRGEDSKKSQKPCWTVNNCPDEKKEKCPAWEFQSGELCWFINGTICNGSVHKDWNEKIKGCRSCDALSPMLKG